MKYLIYLADSNTIEAQRVTKVGPFIVHENVDLTWRKENDLSSQVEYSNKWTLTHLDSSFKLRNFKIKEQALKAARALRDSDIKWHLLKRDEDRITEKSRLYFSKNGQDIKNIMAEAIQ